MQHQRSEPQLPALLNLGCGEDYIDAALNVDVSDAVGPDRVVNLEVRPWPWEDNTFSSIIAHHVLEHLDPVPWGELCRVLKPEGTLDLRYPIGHTRFEDPTHRQYWNWNTAAAIAGDRKHGHEHVSELRLVDRSLNWHVGDRLWRAYVRLRLWYSGPGAWLGQIPGLSGEVRATYESGGQ